MKVRSTLVAAAALLTATGARADVLRFSCGKTEIAVDTAKPSVTLHFATGFSTTYQNGTETRSYKFSDGSEDTYVSTETVSVDAKAIRFSNHYQKRDSAVAIDNIIDLKTSVWHHQEGSKSGDTPCARQ